MKSPRNTDSKLFQVPNTNFVIFQDRVLTSNLSRLKTDEIILLARLRAKSRMRFNFESFQSVRRTDTIYFYFQIQYSSRNDLQFYKYRRLTHNFCKINSRVYLLLLNKDSTFFQNFEVSPSPK